MANIEMNVYDRMTDDSIDNLAINIAKTFLNEKTMGASIDFINTFLDVYEVSKKVIIQRRENLRYQSNLVGGLREQDKFDVGFEELHSNVAEDSRGLSFK